MLRLTRHARNRMRLFGIRLDDVEAAWDHPATRVAEGSLVKCMGEPLDRYGGLPLLIVVDPETDPPTVVSAYPFKARRKRS